MKTTIQQGEYNTCLEASDWRYGAAIVGLLKYLKYHDFLFSCEEEKLYFNREDMREDKYLEFVEYAYRDKLQHKLVEQALVADTFDDLKIKQVNDWLKGNTIMKKVFGKVKFDGTNKEVIQELITANRRELIKETFRNKKDLYANYCNTGQLMEEDKPCCRLVGYYIDLGKKGKSIAYLFDTATYYAQDDAVFDFIPFAFTGDREAFYIHDSATLEQLQRTNLNFKNLVKERGREEKSGSLNARKALFSALIEVSDFLNYDIEVIVKNQEESFFETMYIRRESIRILKSLKRIQPFCFFLKMNDTYINIQKEVTNCILNLRRCDDLLELLLNYSNKNPENDNEYIVSLLIGVNAQLTGGEEMKQYMKIAYACAKDVAEKIPANKREGYRQKLTSAIVFKDYNRFCEIVLNISNYVDQSFDFMYPLYENFEDNKDIAYTFINALTKKKDPKEGTKDE